MKNYKTKKISSRELVSVTCDCCGITSKDTIDTNEWLHWSDRCGYGNIHFGDLNYTELDLCQTCTFELLGKYVRVKKSKNLWDYSSIG